MVIFLNLFVSSPALSVYILVYFICISRKVKLSLKFHCVFDRLLLSSPIIPDMLQTDSAVTPLRRAETMGRCLENSPKVNVQKSISLDRHTLRPLNLINGCNSTTNLEIPYNPLIAVIDKSNKIQVSSNIKKT